MMKGGLRPAGEATTAAGSTAAPGPQTVAVSVDLDAPLDYCRFYRLAAEPPSEPFLAEALPRLLDLFAALGVRATFFAIGRDAGGAEAGRLLRRAVAEGHEIANHSHTHPHAFRALSRAAKQREIDDAGQRLEEATGQRVVGFRCPAYDLDRELLDLLLERGYRYDSSLNPTPFLVPMKWVIQWRARRWHVGLGRVWHGWGRRRPYFLFRQGAALRESRRRPRGPHLVELPLSVVPGVRFPFYGTISQILPERWFRLCLAALRRGRLPINYSLHAAEVASLEAAEAELCRSVPGYAAPVAQRRARLAATLAAVVAGARSLTLAELAAEVSRAVGGEAEA